MSSVKSTVEFRDWLERLRDRSAQGIIASRIVRAREGNLGRTRPVGGGIHEMKIDFGPGYRVYFTYDGPTLVVLLIGGDKSSQDRDIEKARRLAELKEWRA